MYELLGQLSYNASVSLVEPRAIIPELFTRSGSGTYVRFGERIHVFDNTLEGIDLEKVHALLEQSFGGTLANDYWQRLNADGRKFRVYVTDTCLAAAVVTVEPSAPANSYYMDKLVVHPSLQGRGVGDMLWDRIR